MPFTRRELQAMARLSPARRKAICAEVYRETTRGAYLAARDYQGLEDAGMGRSLKKAYKSAKKKVEHVISKVEDTAKGVIDKVEDVAKKIQEEAKELGQKVKEAPKKIAKAAKRLPTAVKRFVRKAAPVLVVGAPFLLGIKSVRKSAAKFYKKHGALIVTITGTALAPFTGGLSAMAATLIVSGKKIYDTRKAAIEAEKAGKAEAAQMAAAVREQEAALNAQCDQIYSEARESFELIGLTPEKWQALSVDAKMGIIDSLSRGEIPPGYALTPQADAEADAVREKALNDELDDLYVKHQATFEAAGYPSERWYALSLEEKYAVLDSMENASQGVDVEQPSQQTTPTTSQSSASTPSYSTSVPQDRYDVMVEGEVVGSASSSDQATEIAMGQSQKGDRVEVLLNGKSMGLAIKTDAGLVPVPAEEVANVRAMSHGEVVSKVSQATAAAGGAKAKGGFPWMLLALPAVIFVGAKAKGA